MKRITAKILNYGIGIAGGTAFFGAMGTSALYHGAIALGETMQSHGTDAISRIAEYETSRSMIALTSPKAATERQRGMDIIRNSKLNARNMFGAEASFLHR